MRPTSDVDQDGVYECQDCGARPEAVESRICPECGGDLLDLGRERDL